MRLLRGAPVLWLLGLGRVAWSSSQVHAATTAVPATFEDLVSRSTSVVDLSVSLPTLAWPNLDLCRDERREIDRARCRAVRAGLKSAFAETSYTAVIDDPDVIGLGAYDARIPGFALTVAGCLACREPLRLNPAGDRHFVTLREPTKTAESIRTGVEVVRATVPFPDREAAKTWLKTVGPNLRTEFVFQPRNAEWALGSAHGFAFALLGVRVFDRCTGQVIHSVPPSAGLATVQDCVAEASTADAGSALAPADVNVPAALAAAAINSGMAPVRPALNTCLAGSGFTGTALLTFVVPGATGVPAHVTVSGALAGTPTGACLVAAGRTARFSRFARDAQTFTYPLRAAP